MSNNNESLKIPVPVELDDRPRQRVYSAEYKRRIVEEINVAPRGGIAAILRREGLYSATVDTWRKELAGVFDRHKRGRKASPETPQKRELERLGRENARLRHKLAQAEMIIDIQKKIVRMFDAPTESNDPS